MTAIDGFLDAVCTGRGIPPGLYCTDAVLDATVPGWRFRAAGPDAISGAYRSWFADPARLEELDRQPLPGGEAVSYLLTWEEDGTPHAAHHVHLLALDAGGRIASDRVWCGGRWPAALLAQMAAASR